MAFGKIQESVNTATSFKLYIGAAPSFVVACNPTKEERNKLFNSESDKEPAYLSTREVEGKQVQNVQVLFYVKPNVEDAPTVAASFFVSKNYRWNRDRTKVQVIDKYGYSGWATEEQCKNHSQLISINGKNLRITSTYRPAFEGEIALIEFIKNYLYLPEALSYVDGDWVRNPKLEKPEDAECYLDMEKLFKGDFSEIREIPTLMPMNTIKIAYGVRNSDNNQYQTVYTNKTMRAGSMSYKDIEKDIDDRKERGGLQNIEIDCGNFREYTVKATDFSAPAKEKDSFSFSDDLPF